MIVLKKQTFEKVKKEIIYIGVSLLLFFIIFKIAFYSEKLLITFKMVLGLFWLFVIPGYFIMFYWNGRFSFLERFIIGFAVAAGIMGIFSYYLGLMGINIKYHTIILPILIIIISSIINYKK